MLLGLLLPLASCTTPAVLRSVTGADDLHELTGAQATQDGRIEIWFEAALAGAYVASDYLLALDRSELQRAWEASASSPDPRRARLVLPRSRLVRASFPKMASDAPGRLDVVGPWASEGERQRTPESLESYTRIRCDSGTSNTPLTSQPCEFIVEWREADAAHECSVRITLEKDDSSHVLARATCVVTLPAAAVFDIVLGFTASALALLPPFNFFLN